MSPQIPIWFLKPLQYLRIESSQPSVMAVMASSRMVQNYGRTVVAGGLHPER